MGDAGAHTTLLVDPLGPGPTGAKVALREADAAADACEGRSRQVGVESTVLHGGVRALLVSRGSFSTEVPGVVRETGAQVLEAIGEHVDHALGGSLQDAADDERR